MKSLMGGFQMKATDCVVDGSWETMFTTEEETETTAREFRMMKAANVSGKLPMVDFYLMRIITGTMIILHRPEVADTMDIRLS